MRSCGVGSMGPLGHATVRLDVSTACLMMRLDLPKTGSYYVISGYAWDPFRLSCGYTLHPSP